jgi:hypothetical protein
MKFNVLSAVVVGAIVLAAPKSAVAATFAYSGIIESYTITQNGIYNMLAYGAQGGNESSSSLGGFGAGVEARFSLQQNDVLSILVGGVGSNGQYMQPGPGAPSFGDGSGGGGGGGTFIVLNGIPLVVAGGGGGGGNIRPDGLAGGGGGGFSANGGAGGRTLGGASFVNGGGGGAATVLAPGTGGRGGFGGGGAGGYLNGGGGGGGGFAGGQGGVGSSGFAGSGGGFPGSNSFAGSGGGPFREFNPGPNSVSFPTGGGGGNSFINADLLAAVPVRFIDPSASQTGNGRVEINLFVPPTDPPGVPTPALLPGVVALGLKAIRKRKESLVTAV